MTRSSLAHWPRRTLAFTRFTLQEYVRSFRILAELCAVVAVVWLFFWPRGTKGLDGDQFFGLGGLCILALTAYTTFAVVSLGKRPQGYVVLARRLGRRGYVLGLYLAALTVITVMYLLLTALVLLANVLNSQSFNLSPGEWLLGSLPLLLNVALLAAFVTLLTPLVITAAPRLLILGGLVVALSRGRDVELIGQLPGGAVWQALQMALSVPLLPALSGFALALQRGYDLAALGILLSQVALTAALLASALLIFDRRDLLLGP